MRRRILLLVFSTTVFALLLLGVLLMTTIWALTSVAMQDRAVATATVAATTLDEVLVAGGRPGPDSLGELARNNDAYMTATLPDGTRWSVGQPVDGSAWTASAIDGGVLVTVSIPTSVKARQVALQGVIVLVIALVALGLAMAVAWVYARRMTRPFDDFRDALGAIATGDRRQLSRRYGIAEIDMVAQVLDTGVSRFDEMLERERQATQDASHQLKSPLTAISMRLEEISTTDDLQVAREEAAVALAQVERLSGVVDQVVGVLRGQRSSMPVDVALDDLVDQQVAEWRPAFHAAGRDLVVLGRSASVTHAESGAQGQALATLLENSLLHGAGATTVTLRAVTGWAVVEVADEGTGVPADVERRVFERRVSGGSGSGLGLALARTLVSGDGGRLEMLSARPAVFAVFLPVRDPDAVLPVVRPAPEGQAEVDTAASSAAEVSSGNTQRR